MKDSIVNLKSTFVVGLLCGFHSMADAREYYNQPDSFAQDWGTNNLRFMGKPKDYEADAPKGYTEHIKYDRKVYPGPTKKEMEKYFKINYAKGVALAKESEHEKILYHPEFH